MPLSEEEQRIIDEIELQLRASDPELVREVGSTTIYRHAGRNLKWSGLGFVAGVAFMIATLAVSPLLAFAGFLAMLGAAILFERNLRKMGRAGWHQWSETVRSSGLRDQVTSVRKRVRERFKKDD